MRLILWFVLTAWASVASAAPGTVTFDSTQFARLTRAPVGAKVEVAEFPVGPGVLAAVRFERIDVYAPGARIVEMTSSGEREVPRSAHVQMIGTSVDGNTRIGLTLDAASAIWCMAQVRVRPGTLSCVASARQRAAPQRDRCKGRPAERCRTGIHRER